jgi:hypothetical protein
MAVVLALLFGLFTVGVALLLPLLPVFFVAFCIWAIAHWASRPAVGF